MVTTLKRWHSTYMCWRGSIRLNTLQKWLRHRFLFINFFWHVSNYTLLIYHLWTNVANWYKFSLRTSLFLFNSYVFFAGQPHNQYNELSQLRKIPFIEHTWSLKRTYSTNHMHQINCWRQPHSLLQLLCFTFKHHLLGCSKKTSYITSIDIAVHSCQNGQ